LGVSVDAASNGAIGLNFVIDVANRWAGDSLVLSDSHTMDAFHAYKHPVFFVERAL
jgi:hypothetical protein